MDAWFHWQIKTQRVIKGPKLRGRIIAARTQHAGYTRQFTKELRLFAVRPITDANVRAKLKADFFLQDMSVAHEVFCLSSEIEVMVEDRHILLPKADGKTRCFGLPDAEQDG